MFRAGADGSDAVSAVVKYLGQNQLTAGSEAGTASINSFIQKIDSTSIPVTIAFNLKRRVDILTTRTSVNEEILVPTL